MADRGFQNILIIKPSSLGDIVHALPILPPLRKAFPDAKITWLVRNQFAPLLEIAPEINELLLFDRGKMSGWLYKPESLKCLLDFRRQLKGGKFDLVLDLQGLLRSALFAWQTGCKARIGLAEAREGARFFYTDIVKDPADSSHILDYYFAVLRQIGIDAQPANYMLSADDKSRASVISILSEAGLKSKQFVVLVPSSAHADKCWSAEKFAHAAQELHENFGLDIAAVGTAGDKEITARIQSFCRYRIADLCGKTNLVELIALFEQSTAVISNDTGPGHIAAAVNVPAVIVFGRTNPLRLGPYNRLDQVAAIDIEKRGRGIDSPNPAWKIEHIPVELVVHKLTQQIENPKKSE